MNIGWKVIFACERQWIFNTIIFNQYGQEMTYDSCKDGDHFEILHPLPGSYHFVCCKYGFNVYINCVVIYFILILAIKRAENSMSTNNY